MAGNCNDTHGNYFDALRWLAYFFIFRLQLSTLRTIVYLEVCIHLVQ